MFSLFLPSLIVVLLVDCVCAFAAQRTADDQIRPEEPNKRKEKHKERHSAERVDNIPIPSCPVLPPSLMSSVSLPAEAAAGLSTRWQVTKKHEGVYTDSAAKVNTKQTYRTHERLYTTLGHIPV